MGISESTLNKQLPIMNAERVWCNEEQDRIGQQLDLTSDTFATVEQVKALCERIGHRLDKATDEDKRFVLESLEDEANGRSRWDNSDRFRTAGTFRCDAVGEPAAQMLRGMRPFTSVRAERPGVALVRAFSVVVMRPPPRLCDRPSPQS